MEPRQILAALPGGGPAGGPGRAAPRGTDTTARLGLRARRGRGRRDPPHRPAAAADPAGPAGPRPRSEEHPSELQSREKLVCRLLLEKKKQQLHVVLRCFRQGEQYGLIWQKEQV